jgi:hypothetical protein
MLSDKVTMTGAFGVLCLGLVLGACSGRMSVGVEEVGGSDGSGDPGGTGAMGSVTSSSGGGSPVGNGGGKATGATAGSSMGAAGNVPDACAFEPNALAPDTRPLLSSYEVLLRLYRFLEVTEEFPISALPDQPTAAWVAMHASRILDGHAEAGTSPPGLEAFLSSWLGFDALEPYETPERWARQLVQPDATLGMLLALPMDDPKRVGILTEPEFLSRHPTISGRGTWMSANLLCQQVPSPPADTNVPQVTGPGVTRRQQLESGLAQSAACTGCHRLIDPLGVSLEHFDEVGEYRELDNGQAVDASATLSSPPYSFENYADLAPQLAASCEVARCFTQLLSTQALSGMLHIGVPELSEPEVNRVARAFVDSGFEIRVLVDGIVRSPSFLR